MCIIALLNNPKKRQRYLYLLTAASEGHWPDTALCIENPVRVYGLPQSIF